MTSSATSDEHERQVRRLAVMLGRGFVMGDLASATDLDAAAVDAEADDYEFGAHTRSTTVGRTI